MSWFDKEPEGISERAKRPRGVYVIRREELREGDVLIVHAERPLSVEECKGIRGEMERQFPDRRCLVLSGGLKLGILGRAE